MRELHIKVSMLSNKEPKGPGVYILVPVTIVRMTFLRAHVTDLKGLPALDKLLGR